MNNDFPLSGHCDARFAGVRDAFLANFTERGEIGAAVTVFINGKTAVDLIGGWRDQARTQQWQPDTLVNVWSSTKGVVATCFAMLV